MAIYKPSELKHFLNDLGIQPKKGLSQNFLIDGNIIRKIVKTAQVSSGDLVLEIGPGPGSLTEALLETKARVIAVEKDNVLADKLKRLQNNENQLEILCDDILNVNIPEILKSRLQQGQKAKVIANLPYHLTSLILTHVVQMHEVIESMTVMVQDEVARRMTAVAGNKDFGSLTLFLNYYSQSEYGFKVSKNCFFPVPKVESAIVNLRLREPPQLSNKEHFFEMTRTAFMHRRKMLKASLRELYGPQQVEEALSQLHLDPKSRPENLSLQNFIDLYQALQE